MGTQGSKHSDQDETRYERDEDRPKKRVGEKRAREKAARVGEKARDENDDTKNPRHLWWTVSGIASVILPLVIYIIGRFLTDGEGGGREDERGLGSILFVYIFSVMMFLALLRYGSNVLGRNEDKARKTWWERWTVDWDVERLQALNVGVFIGAVVVFAAFSLICFVLMVNFKEDFKEGGMRFSKMVAFQFLFWFILCSAFSVILIKSYPLTIEDDDDEMRRRSKRKVGDTGMWA
mmetsp:Transcript_8581/g.12459  ORF Transcript_8581/g.12459 Transcript_8581/m.12459 type:complete len:235 (-) Transcript_8581:207-911(-)|eukprot:CAMPEP_0195518910 /NCGR_PEP_ID=MMETSP0794_2-20130614/13927_1 /TAXON_ID=515487 /ORGANISM="Stephanopyxis turris, Strain CCMP 815" /LENGTH=234 /DNA_ID=CAMNT_0040647955 /DNA_START=71 /DNA_END=775 /DNA_ORIENTATION=+